MPSRIALIVNPTSGKGAGAAMGEQTARLLRTAGHEVIDVSAAGYALAHAAAATALGGGVDTLVVVGGDGMVHLGVNLCAGTPVRLGVVAAGTGNDFARNLGLPVRDPAAAVRVIHAGVTRAVDAGKVTDAGGQMRWFGGVLGAGFDAVVAARAARMRWPRGAMRYNLAIARELPVFHAIPYVVDLDGERLQTRAMLVAVANTTSFGGGMKVCPDADVSDGLFDVLIVHELSIAAFLRVFPRVFSGTHVGHRAVDIRRARRVRLEADGIHAQADGEPLSALPLDIEVVPAALQVAVPDPEGSR
ncbi:sphingosine kinase [Humibacillus sp. DSM 29435]|uniref:diacylglycerol/lipid kinase family protein n=1 Tax=Humibacillus sp. DSM 29435 TaxID=1869167 RepID=UPI000871F6F4|nr:YegS/Rv2252/BmrU family lipid kinase [Humibacillus sp. DSM 29435]OFE17554.1 sphingosine kinase [Humibacillus sp. DSM 29435]